MDSEYWNVEFIRRLTAEIKLKGDISQIFFIIILYIYFIIIFFCEKLENISTIVNMNVKCTMSTCIEHVSCSKVDYCFYFKYSKILHWGRIQDDFWGGRFDKITVLTLCIRTDKP